jgi:hypothetical protein
MKSIVMDIVVAYVPPNFGMFLSRSWIKILGGTLQMDLSYSWARDMITFMTVIIHFFRMYICVFHILKELFEEFYFKTV